MEFFPVIKGMRDIGGVDLPGESPVRRRHPDGVGASAASRRLSKSRTIDVLPQWIEQLLRKAWNLAVSLLHLPVYLVSGLMLKDRRLWVFGAWGGRSFSDNSRAMLEWVRAEQPDIKAVWLARDRALVAQLRARGIDATLAYGLRGYWLSARAAVAVISNSRTGDINRFAVAGRTRVVQLWHGTPIKKIGRDDRVFSHDATTLGKRMQRALNKLSDLAFPAQRERWDLFTAASDYTVPNYATAFGLDRRQIVVTGLARTDSMLSTSDAQSTRAKRVLYLPTFRGQPGSTVDVLDGADLGAFDAMLESAGAELAIKLHPANVPERSTIERIDAVRRVSLLGDTDVHCELSSCDVLITDYSSVFIDYLLLDRPIVFFAPDLSAYLERDRQLYYAYDEITPGPRVGTWQDLVAATRSALEDPEQWADARARVRTLFHDHTDAGSCQRIWSAIRELQAQ